MKTRFLFIAALAAMALCACQREKADTDGKPVEVNVTIQGTVGSHDASGLTRATSVTYENESKVENLQVYVFNDGRLEDYRDAGEAMTAQLTATSGPRTVWALVNAPSLKDVSTESELKAKVSQLSENRTDGFVMSGSTTQDLKDGGTVPVTVKRLVSRVSVKKISTDFQYALAQESLTVDAIYLINVAGDSNYAADGTPATWVNQLGHKDNGFDTFLYDKVGTSVQNSKAYEKEHVFYPYPNPTEKDTYEATWTPRHTMLVVEVTFESKKGYYPVVLPVLERNKTYVIDEMVIRHRPGDVPYQPIETGDATVQITVNDWELGLNMGKITL